LLQRYKGKSVAAIDLNRHGRSVNGRYKTEMVKVRLSEGAEQSKPGRRGDRSPD
jgi:hypothetical protein